MALELLSFRLLAPFVGNSLPIWATILASILAFLALGSAYGGRAADKHTGINFLLKTISYSGIYFLLANLLTKPLIDGVRNFFYLTGTTTGNSWLTLLVMVFLFGPPICILGAITPYLTKLASDLSNKIGEASGLISAYSTAGSLLGVFVSAFYIIPNWGTRIGISFFSFLLIVLGAFGQKRYKGILLIIVGLSLIVLTQILAANQEYIYQKNSYYQSINIHKTLNNQLILSFDDSQVIQSVYDPLTWQTGYYYDYYALLPFLKQTIEKKKVLILGGGGGSVSRALVSTSADKIEVTDVEMDAEVSRAAEKYFDYSPNNLIAEDGRTFLTHNKTLYDIVVVDTYQNNLTIPWTFTTQEFWYSASKNISENGVVVVNINSTRHDGKLIRAIENSQAKVFSYVYAIPLKNRYNHMIIASKHPIDFNMLKNRIPSELETTAERFLTNPIEQISYDARSLVLTDDKAPVEQLGIEK